MLARLTQLPSLQQLVLPALQHAARNISSTPCWRGLDDLIVVRPKETPTPKQGEKPPKDQEQPPTYGGYPRRSGVALPSLVSPCQAWCRPAKPGVALPTLVSAVLRHTLVFLLIFLGDSARRSCMESLGAAAKKLG